MSYKSVFRTARATLGLLITVSAKNKSPAQAARQTLPDATPPVGKMHPFSKIAVTLNQFRDLDALQDLESL